MGTTMLSITGRGWKASYLRSSHSLSLTCAMKDGYPAKPMLMNLHPRKTHSLAMTAPAICGRETGTSHRRVLLSGTPSLLLSNFDPSRKDHRWSPYFTFFE